MTEIEKYDWELWKKYELPQLIEFYTSIYNWVYKRNKEVSN